MPKAIEIGARIAAARHRKGLSQRQLSQLIGVTLGAVGQYETGATIPRPERFEAIARVCEVKAEWLLTGDDPDELRRAQTENEQEALRLIRKMPFDKQESALAMLAGLAASAPEPEKKT